jgi:hypothetical protein
MSPNVKKIKKALNELGLILIETKWTPWGKAMEMQGIEGGWFVEALDPLEDDEYDFQGLSTEEVLEEIYKHAYRQGIDFWGHCEYPETKHSFFNDYGFGQHISVSKQYVLNKDLSAYLFVKQG